ncbi:MAG: archaetidylserine decarboxylase [Xanthomonadales bacterium]|jgi:phosphatidylserine decarboxylase|nr:archaetidylserine decarboxylase [Xanthomonadales bacterium]
MPTWLEKPLALLQDVLPQHGLTQLVHRFMRSETGWLKNAQISAVGKLAGIDFSEAVSTDPDDYRTFNAFFTRELKPGARPLDPDPDALLSPCDGRVSECGALHNGRILQAKGHDYSIGALLADDPVCDALRDGRFWTIYLSPKDYHRVHMPLAGTLQRMIYVPGKLYSVAPYTVRHVPGLFAANERVVCVFDTDFGPFVQVLVGAMLVASMDTVWAGTVTPAPERTLARTRYAPGEVWLDRGEEMGRFNMGSTVISLLPPGVVADSGDALPRAGDPVRVGQRIAGLVRPGTDGAAASRTGMTTEGDAP